MILGAVLVGVPIALIALHFLARAYGVVEAGDLRAMHVVTQVPPTRLTNRLFYAYLSRARRYRTTASVAGWTAALVLAASLGTDRVSAGSGGRWPWYSDVLLMGFGGYLAGAVIAELHHLRGRTRGVRTAAIVPRRLSDYASRRQQWLLRSIGLVAIGVLACGLVVDATVSARDRHGQFRVPMLAFGVAALTVWAIVEWTERAVVLRPRPALPDDLALGDDAIRVSSVETLALGGAGIMSLLVAGAIGSVTNAVALQGPAVLVAFSALLFFGFAIGLAFRTRRVAWPQRRLEKDGL